jgi:hypothetical protein
VLLLLLVVCRRKSLSDAQEVAVAPLATPTNKVDWAVSMERGQKIEALFGPFSTEFRGYSRF